MVCGGVFVVWSRCTRNSQVSGSNPEGRSTKVQVIPSLTWSYAFRGRVSLPLIGPRAVARGSRWTSGQSSGRARSRELACRAGGEGAAGLCLSGC